MGGPYLPLFPQTLSLCPPESPILSPLHYTGKRGRYGPPIATYIYYLIILGGKDIMDNDDKGFFNRFPYISPSALYLLPGMPATPRADKISHGLCLFLRYLYTFTMIPFFALLASEAVYWGVHDQVRGVQRMVSWEM
jgi:hypothetical protein